ncbi:AAA family ATPase [Embleya sp. AB8]|uniref:helix-turn-helix transcriptional regulator n=1 Tax=Embleya sp. AB8 TaxID=3156304 RepID=UPI003C719541
MIERDDERAELLDLFTECQRNRGGVAVISGPMGCGKTELLRDFGNRVTADGLLLSAFGARAEQGVPLSLIDQLLHNAASSSEDIVAAATPELAELRACAPGISGLHMMRDLGATLRRLAEHSPVVISVDDAHYADKESLQALLYCVHRLSSSRALAVFSVPTILSQEFQQFHADVLRLPHARHIGLTPLSEPATTRLVAETLDVSAAHPLVSAIYATTGGNPLLIRALVEETRMLAKLTEGELPAQPVAGEKFGRAVASGVRRGEPDVRQVAAGLAVLDADFSLTLLYRLVDMDPVACAQIVQALRSAGLLDGGRFRHPSIRRAVVDGLTPQRRGELYRRAAVLLHEQGTAAPSVARYLLSADGIEAAWALPVLKEAAETALLRDDVEFALGCLGMALRLCDDEAEYAELKVVRARAERRADPSASNRMLPPMAVQADEGGQSRSNLITSLLADSTEEDVVDMLEHIGLLRLPYSFPSPAERVRKAAVVITAASAEERGSARAMIKILTRGTDEGAIAHAEQVLQGSPLTERTVDGLVLALMTLIYADRLDTAQLWCDTFLAQTITRRADAWAASPAAVRAEIALRRGDLTATKRHAGLALSLVSSQRVGIGIGLPLACMIRATTEAGAYREAAELLARPVPPEMYETRFGMHYRSAWGHYRLATDRADAALEEFTRCGESMRKWGIDRPSLVPWRTDAALAHLRLGNRLAARALAVEQLQLGMDSRSRTRGISLRVLALTGEAGKRPALQREAVEILEGTGDRLHLVRALRDLAATSGEREDAAQARILMRRAEKLAADCGIGPVGAAESPPAFVEDAAIDTLSKAEHRVAMPAGAGYSNPQIARRLFITVSTVEQHLTRVYRKLNLCRHELAAWFGVAQGVHSHESQVG